MRPQRSPLCAALFSSIAAVAPAGIQDECSELANNLIIQAVIADFAQDRTIYFAQDTLPAPLVVDVDFCRVALDVATTSKLGIVMEAWLPQNWSGRFVATGNAGLTGCLAYDTMAYTVGLGFSTVGANNGHNGSSGRSVHTSTVVGKQISETFYYKKTTKSYFISCSTGGRKGFKTAQSFPEDFDGIVAGAPALHFNNFISWLGTLYSLTGPPGSPTYLTPDQWVAVYTYVMTQCDRQDGNIDGLLEEPSTCRYIPELLLCPPDTPANTLPVS